MRLLIRTSVALMLLPARSVAADHPAGHVTAWMITPFLVLLLAIAFAPFIHRHWWEKNYPRVSLGLGFLVLSYYLLQVGYVRMAESLVDYFSFISLIGSLFVAAGGIYLHTERHATPWLNTCLLGVGAAVSNLLGTTGASMLLIRPYLRINRPRLKEYHVVFFIFVVSNMGGALTPIGDPPLFLGYLNGVPFHWTLQNVWHIWLMALGTVLAAFLLVDTVSYRRWARTAHRHAGGTRIELQGSRNFLFLLLILVAVFVATPQRELLMIVSAAAAYKFAPKSALRANEFSFAPIKEVAILFAGIFITMVPALDWLEANAARLRIASPGQFFWAAGLLSSFLDNAPTYLNFLSAALGLHGMSLGNLEQMHVFVREHSRFLQAISIGSVFFGAMTYIGNGPNFMVKSIAEHAGAKCPSFFGYLFRYAVPILLPVFVLVWYLFFR